MAKMRQILIIGNNDNGCTPELEKIAYDAGKHVAESNSVLITGGLGGVMKAASHGASPLQILFPSNSNGIGSAQGVVDRRTSVQ